jgi:signal peptidase II
MPIRWPRPFFYVIVALVIVVDQLTKAWVVADFQPEMSMPLIPGFFNLTYVQNTGIAFGMMKGQGLLVGLFVLALAMGAIYYTRGLNWSGWEPNVIGAFLCGGALGNLLDRSRLGYVVDFFDVHLGPHHWPVFNVADSLICIAVGWIVWRQLVIPEKQNENRGPGAG